MLQMLNVDIKKSGDIPLGTSGDQEGSDEDLKHSHSLYGKKHLVLPNVVTGNIQRNDLNISTELQDGDDHYKPKV
jgi:hypothetical protein